MGNAGGMAEWSKAAVLKTVNRKVRGFESCSLRQNRKNRPAACRGVTSKNVMPVKTGIQKFFPDSRLRGNDQIEACFEGLH